MHANLRTKSLVVMLVLTVSAVGHAESQPASPGAESGAVDPAVAARLTVAQVDPTIAGGTSLAELLRAVARPQSGSSSDPRGAACRRADWWP